MWARTKFEHEIHDLFKLCLNSVQTLFKQCSNSNFVHTLFIHCSNSFIKIQILFIVCSIFVLPFSWSDLEGKLCSQFVQVHGSQRCPIHIVFKLCSSHNFKFILCSNQWAQTKLEHKIYDLFILCSNCVQTMFKFKLCSYIVQIHSLKFK